ncbi:YibE/F family protein [Clostridium akagii]|uniref:YibE/F family protein n=1 Tax=Clostridium akagii TaxID=91623 RepID=UPI00047B0CB1|nr:YibE/F family protein [Clostridium akagii]
MDKKKKEIIITAIVLLLVVIIFCLKNFVMVNGENQPIHAKIISDNVNSSSNSKAQNSKNGIAHGKVQVKISTGDHKGETLSLDNLINDKTYRETTATKGDDVLINITENPNGTIKSAYMYELDRYEPLYLLILIFVLLLGIVGGIKGLKAVLALIITGIVILKVLIPLIIAGFNPIVVSVILSIGISILSLLIISGKNKKTVAAIIGTIGGVIIAALIAVYFSNKLNLTGLTDEEIQMMIYISQNTEFNFRGLMFAGILMGALGAVMDVSMSIASSINEVKQNRPNSTTSELIMSGMNIGRDIMGTMANTLILAYVGGSMYVIMLVTSYKLPMYRILDQDAIASAVLNSLAGSIGLICTIPITAVAAAILFKRDVLKTNIDDNNKEIEKP